MLESIESPNSDDNEQISLQRTADKTSKVKIDNMILYNEEEEKKLRAKDRLLRQKKASEANFARIQSMNSDNLKEGFNQESLMMDPKGQRVDNSDDDQIQTATNLSEDRKSQQKKNRDEDIFYRARFGELAVEEAGQRTSFRRTARKSIQGRRRSSKRQVINKN